MQVPRRSGVGAWVGNVNDYVVALIDSDEAETVQASLEKWLEDQHEAPFEEGAPCLCRCCPELRVVGADLDNATCKR